MTVQNHCVDRDFRSAILAVFALSFITVLLLPSTIALTIDDVKIDDTLDRDSSLHESIQLTIAGNTRSSFTFLLPQGAQAVRVDGASIAVENGSVVVPLSCTTCTLRVEYMLDGAAVQNGEYVLFSRTLNLPVRPKRMAYEVFLPKGFGVGSKDASEPAVVPQETAMRTDGDRIILSWTESDPELPKRYYVSYHDLETVGFTWREFITELQEGPVLVMLFLVLIIGSGIGLLFRKLLPRRKIAHLAAVPGSLLSPDEKTVLKTIEGGVTSQKEIGRRLNWSKSKVSAILSNLEYKKIIAREKIGRNCTIELLKRFEE